MFVFEILNEVEFSFQLDTGQYLGVENEWINEVEFSFQLRMGQYPREESVSTLFTCIRQQKTCSFAPNIAS